MAGKRAFAGILLAVGAAMLGASAASASDSIRTQGASIRLVGERPNADGWFRAALLVELAPGWKTYWLDPGEAGLPPRIAPAGNGELDDLRAAYPAPHRVDDGFSRSTVFSKPFAIALTGRLARADGSSELDLQTQFGLCLDICLPVSGRLSLDMARLPAVDPSVQAAFAALPKDSAGAEGIRSARAAPGGQALDVTIAPARLARGADLFLSGGDSWSFGPPALLSIEDGTAILRVPITARPRRAPPTPASLTAILAAPDGAWRKDAFTVAP